MPTTTLHSGEFNQGARVGASTAAGDILAALDDRWRRRIVCGLDLSLAARIDPFDMRRTALGESAESLTGDFGDF